MNHTRFLIASALAALALGVAGCPSKEDHPPKPKVSAGAPPADPLASRNVAANAKAAASDLAATQSADTAAGGAQKAAATLPTMGPAPAWKLTDMNGKPVSSDQFKGKVVVLDFWATWCPPCVKEIPGYVDLAQKYGQEGLVIVGVSLDQAGPEVVKKFAERHKVGYPLVMGDQEIVSAYGGVEAIPTTFLIDREGRIRDKKVGAEETAEYEKKIVALLR